MKKTLLTLSIILLAFTSCKDNDSGPTPPGNTQNAYINASDITNPLWFYFSFENGIVGQGELADADFAAWSARKDWDIAIKRYNIRTNSGKSSSTGALGGVFICPDGTKFASITNLPAQAAFVTDTEITSTGMGGTTTTCRSEAVAMLMKKNEAGETIMPPVYLKPPVSIFRTANGENYYKVDFIQYVNDAGKTGHVIFEYAKIYKD